MGVQDPWIQNATVRENVLMCSEYNEDRYNSVLAACALEPDLVTLSKGDATEIGEKGVTLSGALSYSCSLFSVLMIQIEWQQLILEQYKPQLHPTGE